MKRIVIFVLASLFFAIPQSYANQPGRVRVYSDLDKPVILAGNDNRVVIKVGLYSDGLYVPRERLPLNIAIVLDKSGSMGSQNKMENAKIGAIEIVERLTKNDIFSLVVYDSSPRVLIPAQYVKNKGRIISLIKDIQAGGSTALYGGVTFGASEIMKYASDEYINRIILLSDGLANVGPQSPHELARLGRSLNRDGLNITTIGVGLDYNEDLMTSLAEEGGGNSYFASNSDELPEIFAQEIGEAITLMAKDIKIRIDCEGRVKPISVIGRKGVIYGKQMEVTINNLYGKNEKYVLFEIDVPQGSSGEKARVAQVNVEYTDPYTKKTLNKDMDITLKYDSSKEFVEKNQNMEIVKVAALNRTSEIKEKAIRLADNGKHEEAAKLFEERSAELDKIARECNNDEDLKQEAVSCCSYSRDTSKNKGMKKFLRKRVRNDAYTYKNQQHYAP